MDADMRINDKLLPGQTDPLIRDLSFRECPFRDTDVHHDLCPGLRYFFKIQLVNLKLKEPLVDVACLAL